MKRPPDMTWRTGSDGRLLDVSGPWLDFVGRSREQFLEDWQDVIHSEDRHRVAQDVTRHMAMTRRTRYIVVYRVRAADGGYVWVRTIAHPLEDGGYYGVTYRSRRCLTTAPSVTPRLVKIVEHVSRMARATVG